MDAEGWTGDDEVSASHDEGSAFSFSSWVIGVASPRGLCSSSECGADGCELSI